MQNKWTNQSCMGTGNITRKLYSLPWNVSHEKSCISHKLCFELIECGLKNTTWTRVQDMVVMFLHMVGFEVGNKNLTRKVSVLRGDYKLTYSCNIAYLRLSFKLIKPQDRTFREICSKIWNDQWYWPFSRIP